MAFCSVLPVKSKQRHHRSNGYAVAYSVYYVIHLFPIFAITLLTRFLRFHRRENRFLSQTEPQHSQINLKKRISYFQCGISSEKMNNIYRYFCVTFLNRNLCVT